MSSEGVQVPPGALNGWSSGSSGSTSGKREVQSFIGVVHFYRDHIFLLRWLSLYMM